MAAAIVQELASAAALYLPSHTTWCTVHCTTAVRTAIGDPGGPPKLSSSADWEPHQNKTAMPLFVESKTLQDVALWPQIYKDRGCCPLPSSDLKLHGIFVLNTLTTWYQRRHPSTGVPHQRL